MALQGKRFAIRISSRLLTPLHPKRGWEPPGGCSNRPFVVEMVSKHPYMPISLLFHLSQVFLDQFVSGNRLPIFTLFPINALDPLEDSLAPYYSSSSISIHIKE